MKCFLFAFFLFARVDVPAQVVRPPEQPPWLGLTAANTRFLDPFSAGISPASVAFVERPVAAVCSEIKFLQTDLRTFSGAAAFPLQGGGAVVNINYLGTEGFSQAMVGLGYAKRLGARVSLGIRFNYHRITVRGYGGRQAISAGIGAQFTVSEKIAVFFSADNPVGGKLGKGQSEKMSSAFTAGIGDSISEKVFISAITVKEESSPVKLYFLTSYAVDKKITIFAGISTSDAEGFIGSSIDVGSLLLKQAVGWKQGLGISPSLAVFFQKRPKQ